MNKSGRKYEFPSELIDLVQTMPLIEAEELLIDRKRDVLARLYRETDGEEKVNLGYVISALNQEIHVVSQKMHRASMANAVRNLFGEEAWAQCRQWMAQQESA